MSIDPEALGVSLRRLAHQTGDADSVLRVLREVASACVDLFRVNGSGIMLADEQSAIRGVVVTNDAARVLEAAETAFGQGPCTDAFVFNRLTFSRDLAADERWPEVAAAAVPYGVRAVLGVPIRLGGSPVGTLDVFLDRPHEWAHAEREALSRYSGVIETALTAALDAHTAGELAAQLQYALDYRVVIDRGVGYLMARDHIDAVAAFNRLRHTARGTRTKIGDVAEHLMATGQLPSRSVGVAGST